MTSDDLAGDLADAFQMLLQRLCRTLEVPADLEAELRSFGAKLAATAPRLAGASSAGHDARTRAGFLMSLAHDLRAPIGAMMHQTQLLASDGLTGDLRDRSMAVMETNAAELEQLLETLADIERLTLGEFEVHLETTDLSALLRDVVSERAEGSVHLELGDSDLEFLLDPVIVRRVVRTLLGSLRRNVGHWTMSVHVEQDEVVICSRRDGAPPSDTSTVDGPDGVTLDAALQLAVALAELHRGRVTFDLHEGRPIVEVAFPLADADLPLAPPEPGWVAARSVPVREPDDALLGWVGMVTDIDERKRTEQQIRALASKLTMAEHEERRRIAHVLHDDLQQRLHSVQMRAGILREELGDLPEAATALAEIGDLLTDSVELTRSLAVDLSPPILAGEGLAEAVAWLAAQMSERHGLRVEVESRRPIPIEDDDMRVFLFQIVRELLFNVVKHAGVDEATVVLDGTGDALCIEVVDRGRGFAMTSEASVGMGLASATERLALFGGRIDVESEPGAGTTVRVTIPPDSAR